MGKKKTKRVIYDPANDGVDHINILSRKGKTQLGRRLSHFAHSPFTHPFYGAFQSMEGFWQYASTGFQHEFLRDEIGLDAKRRGRELKDQETEEDDNWYVEFTEDVLAGNYLKIIQDPSLAQMMIESELPFTHYYLFIDPNPAKPPQIRIPRESDWLCKGFEKIREALKKGTTPDFWDQAQIRYATNVANGRPAHQSRFPKNRRQVK